MEHQGDTFWGRIAGIHQVPHSRGSLLLYAGTYNGNDNHKGTVYLQSVDLFSAICEERLSAALKPVENVKVIFLQMFRVGLQWAKVEWKTIRMFP